MKKSLLFAFLIGFASLVNAQAIFSEDFESGMPSSFITLDIDNQVVASQLSNFPFQGNGWIGRTTAGNGVATSTSWYTPAGQSNDWMITPEIAITGADYWLLFDAFASDDGFPDGYEVRISTQGSATTDFTAVELTIPAENPEITTRAVDLSAYDGETIRIAFINNSNDMFLLNVDNIEVTNDVDFDDVEGLAFGAFVDGYERTLKSRYSTGDAPLSFYAQFQNNGVNDISSLELSLSVNGNVTTQTLTGLSIGALEQFEIESPLTINFTTAGTYNVEFWVSAINGVADTDPSNDKITASFEAFENFTDKLPLFEMYTSSTCGPCAGWNINVYSQVLPTRFTNVAGSATLAGIKTQVPIPSAGDPSNNADADDRRAYYGVNSAPTVILNGKLWDPFSIDGLSTFADARGFFEDILDDISAEKAFIEMDARYSFVNDEVKVEVDVTPLEDLTGDFTVHIAVLNESYIFSGSQNGDTAYSHVMRKYIPSVNGTSFTTFTANQTETVTGSQTFTIGGVAASNFNLWNDRVEVVAFVQDESNQEVMQSVIASKEQDPLAVDNRGNLEGMKIFPNPSNGQFNIQKPANVDTYNFQVFDITGKIVTQGVSANNLETVSLDVENGMYFVRVFTENAESTYKILVD